MGKRIGKTLKPGSVISLNGPLGAGKTVLVKGIAQSLNIKEEITSPTFTLISEYTGDNTLYHMDLYRIDTIEEFELLGAEEFLYGDGISIVEWSEKAENIFPKDYIKIEISINNDNSRSFCIKGLDI